MEKEVVADADVDEEEELRKVFKFVNLLWLHGLILGETLEAARKISAHQGYHEHQVSCGGEADLLRHYTRCQKNPGHRQFIPVRDFKIEHLPLSYRDKLIFDWIRAEADRTCRLLVTYTSANRPKYHPFRPHLLYPFSHLRDRDFMRAGTGYVCRVEKYAEGDTYCECEECSRPSTHIPKKVWGKVGIYTAMHVVFDDDEARRTTCYFGHDTRTTLVHKCIRLKGLRVDCGEILSDGCLMTYVTHDMDIINKLYEMHSHRKNLFAKVVDKFVHYKHTGLSAPGPVIIISHPHRYSKHITVGTWTDRQTWGEAYKQSTNHYESILLDTSYTYNAHTCPGSSGAPVFILPEKGKYWMMSPHCHSEAGEGNTNNNKSVVMQELDLVKLTTLRTSN